MKQQVEKISLWQLYILIVCFQIGSAALVGIGNEAKQDAWIAVIIGTFFGIAIMLYYLFLLSKMPEKNLFELLVFCFGKWIGKLITLLYVIYFFYISARVLRDFCELLVSTIFEVTPLEVISITMMLVIVYIFQHGLEVLGRTSEVFFPYVVAFIVMTGLGIWFSGEFEISNVRPILAEGYKPIVNALFPQLLTFPFGEVVTFMVISAYIGTKKHVKKVSAAGVFTSGVLLAYGALIQISTLGVDLKERANFPLLSASREISLLNFIERVDLIIVFFVMFGIIVKVGIFFYGGLKGLELITNKPYRSMTLLMGSLIAFFSAVISHNFVEHIEEGLVFVPFFMHIPFQFGIPLLLLPFILWKTRKKGKKEKKESSS
ncbi:spore gernimation protein KC [Bacillus sp. UMB0899]|uniref:GerAB/ArcD/ProY family transporter n=1 Tax=Metabacillus schmidteae TaxID=2730405 RepID=UPI000C808ACF|nr:endospore germination permease [Metabacillus schmidteae]PMC36742.1 spore gernimation protein KC [Bacillus sp. UMB0899]